MRKTLLSCVVASAMALACTATSFAAVTYGEQKATADASALGIVYNQADNTLKVASGWTAADTQVTLLVVKGDKPSTIDDGDIFYIDQQANADAAKAFENVGLLGTALEVGQTYTVKVGGTAGNVVAATFNVEADAPAGVEILWGDINADTVVDIADANAIASYTIGGPTAAGGRTFKAEIVEKSGKLWGDINADTVVDIADANAIASYTIGGPTAAGGNTFKTTVTIK